METTVGGLSQNWGIHKMELQDALQHFNVGLGQWYGWRKVDDDGNVIPNDQRMTYQHLIIHGDVAVKPTEQEINDKIAEQDATQYQRDRAAAYASIGDQLDMQYHDLQDSTTTWADHVAEIKARFPK